MMFYIDCEFDGFGGDLISMALVGGGGEWYEVFKAHSEIPWVKEHVLPVLHKNPVSIKAGQQSLHDFLSGFGEIKIVADYPADIAYFCNLIQLSPGKTMKFNDAIQFEVVWNAPYQSAVPHNALEDAKALMISLTN